MATVYGVNATKRDVTVPAAIINQGEVNGRVRIAYDEYVAAGALTSGDVIKFMKLPAGARVLNALISSDDLGTTGTAKLGWEANSVDAADDDGFIASIDLNAAAITKSMQGTSVPVPGQFKKFSAQGGETQVSLTLTANTTAGGTIKCAVEYVVD